MARDMPVRVGSEAMCSGNLKVRKNAVRTSSLSSDETRWRFGLAGIESSPLVAPLVVAQSVINASGFVDEFKIWHTYASMMRGSRGAAWVRNWVMFWVRLKSHSTTHSSSIRYRSVRRAELPDPALVRSLQHRRRCQRRTEVPDT